LEKEIFESEDFKQYANGRLVLVNADFPRLRKHQLSPAQQKKNDALAEKYNPNGIFPSTLLLDEEGHILKTWEGFPPVSPSEFVNQVKTVADARN
jgi:thioredoxin-related protein